MDFFLNKDNYLFLKRKINEISVEIKHERLFSKIAEYDVRRDFSNKK